MQKTYRHMFEEACPNYIAPEAWVKLQHAESSDRQTLDEEYKQLESDLHVSPPWLGPFVGNGNCR